MSEELNKKIDDIGFGIKKMQEVADRNSERLDALDQMQLDKINDAVTKKIDEVNTIKSTQENLVKQNEKIEQLLCNIKQQKSTKDGNTENARLCRAEFTKYLRTGRAMSEEASNLIVDSIIEKSFIGVPEEKIQLARKDLQVQVDPDGGYFVRPEISNQMVTRVFESSPVRQFASAMTITSDSVELIIDTDESAGGWVAETDSRPTTDTPKIGKLTMYAHEVYANPRVTQKMIDDAGFDIEAWLTNKVTTKFTRLENNAFVVGDGTKKPRGFLTYPAWTTPGTYEDGKVEQLTSSTTGDFEGDDIKNLQCALIEDYQPNAIFAMRRETFTKVATKKDGEDRYLLDTNSFKTGDTRILLGKTVSFMHDIPAVANNALSIVYGNFQLGYTVVDRIGIRVIRDNYTAKPYILYYTTKRVGGAVTNYEALKILKIAS